MQQQQQWLLPLKKEINRRVIEAWAGGQLNIEQ
jgi:hypothetical protein